MAAEKKKLNIFLNDLLKLGCVKGFKFFATHLRGREEMIVSVVNEPSVPILLSATNSPAVSFTSKDPGSVFISHKRQRRLSGYGFINVGLPPASPSGSEEGDDNSTLFLLAGYARYNCPYVWVRTNHERIVRLSSDESPEKDYPLALKTTSQWQHQDVKVWDVLSELVRITTVPCPPNPFAVDLDYFTALPASERVLTSAAMISFLQRLLTSGTHSYDRRVTADLGSVSQMHFQALLEVVDIRPIASEHSQTEQLTQH